MFNIVENEAIKSLNNALKKLNFIYSEEIILEIPPESNLGDLTTTISFKLAKTLKKNPMEIATQIINTIKTPELFTKIENKGPYINFFINYQKFSKIVLENITENHGQLDSLNTKIILEHTSANPNGPLHIGHIRNAILGDSLSRTLKSAGYTVETQYYVNDMGRQIAMVVWGLLNFNKDLKEYGDFDKIDHKIGDLYFQVNEKLKEDPSLSSQIDEIIIKYESGDDTSLNEKFKFAVDNCLDGMKITMQNLGIHHDKFVWEGEFVKNGEVWDIIDKLKKTGYTKFDEVLFLDLTEFGIEKELVLTRSNGTSLYSTRDLAYHLEKSKHGDIVLDVLGADHKLAVDQISIAMKLLKDKVPEVIFYEFITLPFGSMSTRKGVFVSVDDLLNEAINRAYKEMKNRRPDLSDPESLKIAKIIGIGAIRYYIARLSPEKHIVFDWDEALSFERGCASIQYAHARACKLLEKADYSSEINIENSIWDPEDIEIDLICTISKFENIIKESAKLRRVHNIAQYAQDLANAFNKFYKSVPVIDSEFENERLILTNASKITISNCLYLLGVIAPNNM